MHMVLKHGSTTNRGVMKTLISRVKRLSSFLYKFSFLILLLNLESFYGKIIRFNSAITKPKVFYFHLTGHDGDNAGLPPWVGYQDEAAMKEKILSLSDDKRTFVRAPPAGKANILGLSLKYYTQTKSPLDPHSLSKAWQRGRVWGVSLV